MGLFNLFGKKEKGRRSASTAGDSDEWVTVEVKKSELEAFDNMVAISKVFENSPSGIDWKRKHEEEMARVEAEIREQQERRLAALVELGASADAVTLDKARADMFRISKTLCNIDLSSFGPCEREVVTWQQLTKSGKLPKCVATYSTHWTFYNGDFHAGVVSCEVGYLIDGTPYTARVSDLRGSGTHYKIKMVDGELALIAATPA